MEGTQTFVLGLTGGVGAGKSTVLAYLEEAYGFYVIQTDLAARTLMEPGMPGLCAAVEIFGEDILDGTGSLCRPLLAERMFGNAELRRQLDARTHPLVWEAVRRETAAHRERPVVIETAIPGKEFRDTCREIWYLYTSEDVRAARLAESRGYSAEKTRGIMANQADEAAFARLADARIDNSGPPEETRRQVDRLLAEWGIPKMNMAKDRADT